MKQKPVSLFSYRLHLATFHSCVSCVVCPLPRTLDVLVLLSLNQHISSVVHVFTALHACLWSCEVIQYLVWDVMDNPVRDPGLHKPSDLISTIDP